MYNSTKSYQLWLQVIRYHLPLNARLMLFKSLVLSRLTFSALFFSELEFQCSELIDKSAGELKFSMRKKYEISRDLLVDSDILPAEVLISR